ncbi:glycosyl hydrolase-related protein [Paenibacillus rigui]|uniref:Glycoside hydrolase family 38 N-terminal domain-containing protein n=1 Tax=Paenibacillus rigui TaxID=554312 RepID=A0A229UVJ2_9BACL|nr:glycosyl hydrolase-related protein [Paenibacillus rigui]OXM87617.1 hypothetical protein CF651_03855 [Paenibacillus rigui]
MRQPLEKIYVVFKTHFDIGFTGLASEVVERYRKEMLKDVIDICDQTSGHGEHEKYVWTMAAWPLLQSLQGSEPQDQRKADELVRDRQLIWHKLPYTTHTEFCGLEEWIRGMYVSRGLTERFGYDPKDAKMTDVPGHTWMVPSLLKKAGVHILHLGCNPATTPPDVPPVFYWEGPDGARLLTLYSKGAYGTGIVPPDDWPHPVWLAMIQTSDNHGPHDASVIQEMKASIEEVGLQAELHIGSLGDFAADFLSRNPELPVIRGDMADSWIHGVGTAPREVSRVRELRGRIVAAESALAVNLFTGRRQGGPAAGEKAAASRSKAFIDTSYEQTLLFGEHTWGLDCKTFLFPRTYDKPSFRKEKQSERYRLMEASWREQAGYLDKAEWALGQAVEAMSGCLTCGGTPKDGAGVKQLRVYNTLGWKRDAEVRIGTSLLPSEDEVLMDAATGEVLALRPCGQGAIAHVKALPALGFKTLAYAKTGQRSGDEPGAAGTVRAYMTDTEAVLENPFLTVKVSRSTGWITSLWDKRLCKEWVDAQAASGFGQYEYNVYSNREITRYLKKYAYRFYDWGVHDFGKTDYPEHQQRLSCTTEKLSDIRIVQEGRTASIHCSASVPDVSVKEYGNAREVRWSVTLTEASPFVDMEWRLSGKEETPKAESGHMMFPFKLDRPQFRVQKLGAVLDPCTDLIPSSSTLVHCCEHFVDVSNGFAGMAVIPLDSPLFFLGRNGMWDFEPDYKPVQPEVNFNLFNNWWGTNFPQWVGGDLKYRYRLVPHEGDWLQGQVWKTAQETMAPPMVLPASGLLGSGAIEAHEALTELLPGDLNGLAVTCFKPAEDGEGFILRLRECRGQSRELQLVLAGGVRQVTITDLLERDLEGVDLNRSGAGETGTVRIRTKPFELHTLRLV